MSFAGDVKTELCRASMSRKCCAQAECYGILLYGNTFTPGEVRIITENDAFAQRLPLILKKALKFSFDRLPDGDGKHIFSIIAPKKLAAIQQLFGGDEKSLALHINFGVLEENCCRTAFLRGAFLAGGSVTDPRKGYHLELSTSHLSVSREMVALMREMELEPKSAQRKGNAVIYFKQSDRIEDLLTSIGAPISAMEVMNAKLEKDLRGSVNRQVNCDAANLDKAVEAAMTQVEAIRKLEASGQLALLPDKLRETARLRLEYPEDTLSQLAEQYDPPITKSALNHRLRKLVELGREQ
ncbi:MAG: DNA-binding protein WhiA [Lawsonibacter sp.]|nr:DNA-binding protein WhiA [Lawsonibacter sp.]